MDAIETEGCRQCGNCCRAPGYVRLRPGEPEAIAAALTITVEHFHARYTRLTADRRGLSLIEQADGACVFLQDDNRCHIQAVKPGQCQNYPSHWRTPLLDSNCPRFAASRGTTDDAPVFSALASHN
ncbi:MAG: YkgJ family cysteine cluster protein [Lentisphaerae bacterium]|nr:YkgJ family cysteine cluster protein [Lentisphaerota bacterium]